MHIIYKGIFNKTNEEVRENLATWENKTPAAPPGPAEGAPRTTTRQANLTSSGGKGRTPDPARSSAFERILAEFEHIWRNAGIHTYVIIPS